MEHFVVWHVASLILFEILRVKHSCKCNGRLRWTDVAVDLMIIWSVTTFSRRFRSNLQWCCHISTRSFHLVQKIAYGKIWFRTSKTDKNSIVHWNKTKARLGCCGYLLRSTFHELHIEVKTFKHQLNFTSSKILNLFSSFTYMSSHLQSMGSRTL